jgi:hypothetical protein
MDRRRRMTNRLGHAAQAPMRRSRWPRLQRPPHRLGDLLVTDLARRPRPRLIVQSVKAMACKPLSPLADRPPENPQPIGDLPIVTAFCRRQNDPRPQRQRLARLAPPRQRLKLPPLGGAQLNRRGSSLRHSDLT